MKKGKIDEQSESSAWGLSQKEKAAGEFTRLSTMLFFSLAISSQFLAPFLQKESLPQATLFNKSDRRIMAEYTQYQRDGSDPG